MAAIEVDPVQVIGVVADAAKEYVPAAEERLIGIADQHSGDPAD
jgi:hypothetical protein